MRGPWPRPCLAKSSLRAETTCLGIPAQTSCHLEWSGCGPLLEKEMWFTHYGERHWSTVYCFAGLLVVVAFVLLRINFRLLERG